MEISENMYAAFSLVFYLAVIILLVMLIMSYKENFSTAHAYTAGADQRFKSEFTGPNQGDRTTLYNMEVKSILGRENFNGMDYRAYAAAQQKQQDEYAALRKQANPKAMFSYQPRYSSAGFR
jgi:hypothetical protein